MFKIDYLYPFNPILNIYDILKPTKLAKVLKKYPKYYQIETNGKRFDQLSHQLYQDTSFWVFLTWYNDIINPLDVPEVISYIPKDELLDLINEYKE